MNDERRERFEKWKRSTMSDWKEAQDAALSKEVVKDAVRYADAVVECQWFMWQAAYDAGLEAAAQKAIEREYNTLEAVAAAIRAMKREG